jgi:hypothetical protein
MAARHNSGRTTEDVRRDLEAEREQLATAAESLRDSIGEAANVTGKMREKLPLVAAGALGAGFVLAGGVGATMRLIFRRGREGEEKVRVGRLRVVDRD